MVTETMLNSLALANLELALVQLHPFLAKDDWASVDKVRGSQCRVLLWSARGTVKLFIYYPVHSGTQRGGITFQPLWVNRK